MAWTIGKCRDATYRMEQSLKHVDAIMDFMTVQRDDDILAYMSRLSNPGGITSCLFAHDHLYHGVF